jgi:hypothetical protein
VNAATATLYGAIIAGSFALLGVVVERVLRLMGFLRFEASEWERRFTAGRRNGFGQFKEIRPTEAELFAKRVEYRFAIDLFNGKEVPTGLRDVEVVLTREDGEPLRSRPYDVLGVRRVPSSDARTSEASTVYVINIPPRQFVHKELAGSFDSREAVVALASERWERVEIVAKRPKRPILGVLGSKTYRKTITKPSMKKNG